MLRKIATNKAALAGSMVAGLIIPAADPSVAIIIAGLGLSLAAAVRLAAMTLPDSFRCWS